jgi:hypothetical protein
VTPAVLILMIVWSALVAIYGAEWLLKWIEKHPGRDA